MVAMFETWVLTAGLASMQAAATHLYVCSSEPTTYEEATSDYVLGFKSWGAGACLTGPVAGINPIGMKVTTVDVTDGTIVSTGTASWWAIVTADGLAAHGSLTPLAVIAGGVFYVPPFDCKLGNEHEALEASPRLVLRRPIKAPAAARAFGRRRA
jgi:hypothetical protein